MRKTIVVLILGTVAMLGTSKWASAQDKEAPPERPRPASQDAKAETEKSNAVVTPYRLDFSFYELEDGKKINTRHYTLDVTAGSSNEMKIGTRVPVPIGKHTQDMSLDFQYMDVGTRLWANLSILGEGDLRLDVRSEVSNIDITAAHDQNTGMPPIVRQIQINGSTLLVPGKPILIGSMDDPNSNRQFQLEVVSTKLK